MKILAMEVERDGATSEDFQPHLKAEALRVWELYQANIVRDIFFEPAEHIAILILECESVAEAKGVLDTLPLVQAGLIHFDFKVLGPYPGFGRLFG